MYNFNLVRLIKNLSNLFCDRQTPTQKRHMCQKEEDMSSIYSIGQMNQLADRLEERGFTPDEVTKLGQFENLSEVRGLFRGTHELKQVKHVIDCDADPFCPDGFKVEKHRKGGQLEWGVSKIQFYLLKGQRDGSWVYDNELLKELTDKPLLNANVLDYLLKNPHLIPKEWESKYVFFRGTIYRDSGDDLVVRCLHWHGDEWGWNCARLGGYFRGDGPAALPVS